MYAQQRQHMYNWPPVCSAGQRNSHIGHREAVVDIWSSYIPVLPYITCADPSSMPLQLQGWKKAA